MKTVFDKAFVVAEDCPGCTICVKVCPTTAIHMESKLAVVGEEACFGCNACQQACPFDAIVMGDVAEAADERTSAGTVDAPWTIDASVPEALREQAYQLCREARLHPEQVLCICIEGVRAEHVAAKVLEGHVEPDSLALATGLRSGCTLLCIVGLMLLLEAAGHEPSMPPKGHYNWYPGTLTQFDLPDDLDGRYGHLGYRFADDRALMERVGDRPRGPGE